jgi:hypothetical protein
VTDPPAEGPGAFRRPEVRPDEEFVEGFAEGYGEGLREGLREILQYASRGHTAQELRFLIESRLARLPQDVDLKRRSLLAPPRPGVTGAFFRGPTRAPGTVGPPPPGDLTVLGVLAPTWTPGHAYLFREDRPGRSLDFIAAHVDEYPHLVTIGIRPPSDARLATPRTESYRIAQATAEPAGGASPPLDPGAIAGRVRETMRSEGGAIVFFDAMEFVIAEYAIDAAFRLVGFLVTEANHTGSVVVVSTDPAALEPKDLSRIGRLFNAVI